jgi:SAM-dependent methyltransferase
MRIISLINKLLSFFALKLTKVKTVKQTEESKQFLSDYKHYLKQLGQNYKGFNIIEAFRNDTGAHNESYVNYECQFAAHHIDRLKPKKVLDIGSYRNFIMGMLAYSKITTLDVRERKACMANEEVLTSNATQIAAPDNTFDAVVSLCSLEHFGLGRYGDNFDLEGDKKGFKEMVRLLKPGGSLILTTLMTNGNPMIAFNAHRIYSYKMIRTFFASMLCEEERYYSHELGRYCAFDEVTKKPANWDIYCGCWKKL